jgi:hypothetical protein
MKSFKNIFTVLGLCLLLSMTSCKKWLDVQPADKLTEKELYSTPDGIAEAINGIYLDMGKSKLYGANLTFGTLDVFAQYYNVGSLHNMNKYQTYTYADANVTGTLNTIWTNAYIDVVNVNKFIKNLDTYPGVLDAKSDALLRGEAYGLRAFLQFDLLRMYGPVYGTADSIKIAIPYYKTAGTEINDILPANKVMELIIADLKKAEELLADDPVRTVGVNPPTSTGIVNFLTTGRNYRMNYFAVKGLQARAYLYRGDKVSAAASAKAVIANAAKFPWITTAKILTDKANPDRVFSTELLFGLQSLDMYNNYDYYFSPEVEDKQILAPSDTRLKSTYENNENDYRYNPLWISTGIGGKSYRTFFKYADIVDKSYVYRFTLPLIRLSEMYYIAAESESNVAYLNTVRNKRGLLDLPVTATLATEIQKEYQKEFFGEGQLWYFYKRKNLATIPNPLSASGTIAMNASKYVFPLPLSETTPR